MIEAIDDAVRYIRSRSSLAPEVGVVLGSGLGNVVEAVDIETEIPYSDIPGAKASTVLGHQGRMILGRAGKMPGVLLSGRTHFSEGDEKEEARMLAPGIGRLGIR